MKNDIFAVYKPVGITSHDVVDKVRKITNVKRVGHGGTLDPLAEGVLVIAVGRENTKLLDQYVKGEKEYIATLKLGYESVTDDAEGPITKKNADKIPSREEIAQILTGFIGQIEQIPPIYSAIKIQGKEAYKYARAARNSTHAMSRINLDIKHESNPVRPGSTWTNLLMKARVVEIKEIEIIKHEYPTLELRIVCGSGTYIRSLARDIGTKLATGAYLTKLVRTRVGEFTIQEAIRV